MIQNLVGLTSKRLKIKLSKLDTRSFEKVLKLKCEKFKYCELDNLNLLEEAHKIRFRSPRNGV